MSIFDRLQNILPEDRVRRDEDARQVYGKDWTNFYSANPCAVVFPQSTEEVQQIVQACILEKQPLVPSGGRTGLSGGAVAEKQELVISFEKMNKILDFSETDLLVKVQPGVITESLQEFAASKSLYFPVDFASAGSSQIGGNIATNAGGIHVVQYGGMRNWVAGLEVVTGAGEILRLNEGLVKNATGIDLRHLFIGSEGVLGLITEASIRLTRLPREKSLFLFSLSDWENCLQLFSYFQKACTISAFEVFTQACLEKVCHSHSLDAPFSSACAIYAVVEVEQDSSEVEQILDQVFERGLVLDGVQSQSSAQSAQIWSYRENISESLSKFKPYKNDVSVLASKIPAFISQLEGLIAKEYPDFEVLWFGHVGDGNLHINVLKPEHLGIEEFRLVCDRVSKILFECIRQFKGSISAEHGVGLLKKDYLHFSRSSGEIALMKQVKKLFDPHQIMNPGKVFDLS